MESKRSWDEYLRFIELAGEVNTSMPQFVLNKIVLALNKVSKSVNGSKILKDFHTKNVDDLRESPALQILDSLKKMGGDFYSDPYFKSIPRTRKYNFSLKSVELTPKKLKIIGPSIDGN